MNENVKVLALKYRPKRFEDLVGQGTISQTLSLALDANRLSHAYLFSGLRGSGKTSTARIMAKALLCTQGPTSKPCEVCENCQNANENRHLDIVEMDAASNRGIDDIKDLIEHTKYKPAMGRFKVFIIDEVHMLTTQAFNALLKTLEEPPGFVKFILATTDPLKLPATILSRTQHFRFKKIASKDVNHHLSHILNKEEISFEPQALEIITRSGQGSLRDTLTLLDQAIIFSKGMVSTNAVVDMLGLIDPSFMDEIFTVLLSKGDITKIAEQLEEYEASQVCDEISIYLKNKMLERDPRFDILVIDRFFRIIADAKYLLAVNSDSSFVMILMLSKMIEATKLKNIEDVINEVEAFETKELVQTQTLMPKKETIKEEATQVQNIQESISTKEIEPIPEKAQENTSFESNESINFPTPFDEPVKQDNVQSEHVKEEMHVEEINIIDKTEDTFIDEMVTQSISSMQEPLVNEIENTASSPQAQTIDKTVTEPVIEPIQAIQNNEYTQKFDLVINRVYDRDIQLGEAFEDNFFFKDYIDNELHIDSYAQGEVRKYLFKYFGIIKTFFYDVYGHNTELKFFPQENEKKKSKIEHKEIKKEEPVSQNNNEAGSMIEDIEMGSGCVADMNKVVSPSPSQKELELNDILNSSMMNKAKELFDIKKITVKTKT